MISQFFNKILVIKKSVSKPCKVAERSLTVRLNQRRYERVIM